MCYYKEMSAPKKIRKLSYTRVKELLDYDPKTGIFTWRVYRTQYARIGDRAGTIHRLGYRRIGIDGVFYQCSQLAMLWMTGRWPRHSMDHRNHIRDDDRWGNLRQADQSQNSANRSVGSLGMLKGVFQSGKKYGAQIVVNRKRIYLGTFVYAKQAHAAYVLAAEKHFGEFATFK
jgi:hypothetical protein